MLGAVWHVLCRLVKIRHELVLAQQGLWLLDDHTRAAESLVKDVLVVEDATRAISHVRCRRPLRIHVTLVVHGSVR